MSENHKKSEFASNIIKVGRRGQITLPKIVRKFSDIKEKDKLKVTRMPSGEIHIRKISSEKHPIDKLFEIIDTLPKFDAEKAWREVEKERSESER